MLKKIKPKTMEEEEITFQYFPDGVSADVTESDDDADDHSKIAVGEDESYCCKMCGVSVQSSDSLDTHLQSLHVLRNSANRFPCGCHPCEEVFHTSALLLNHLRREHTVQTFNSCGGCGKKLPRSYSVPTHCRSYPPSKIYCSHCVVEHGNNPKEEVVKDIKVEKDVENKLTSVPNVSLNKSPSIKRAVGQSKSARGDTDSFICQICQLSFSASAKLDAHLHSSHVVVRFSCSSCKEEFKTLEMLMDHLRREHAVEKITCCSQCGELLPTSPLTVPVTRGKTERTKVYCDPCMAERENENTQVGKVVIEMNFEEEDDSSDSNFDVSPNVASSDSDSDEFRSDEETGDSYICLICQCVLSSSDNLDDHLRTLHVVKSGNGCFSCGSCKETFKSLAVLLNHLRNEHTEQKIYYCGQCGRELPSCHSVPTHDRREEPPQIYCKSCTAKRENAKEQAVEVKEDNDCGEDGDTPVEKSTRKRSKSVVKNLDLTAEEIFSAVDSIRPKTDEQDDVKTSPSKVTPKKKQRKFTCGTCSRKFWNRRLLLDHEQNHCSDNRCEVCDKKYSSRDNLRRHLLTHSGAKPYLCETCGKGFSQKHVLTDHQRRHTGERPFSCDICSRSFAQKSLLQQHRSCHMQSLEPGSERPFSCTVCDRTYKSRAALYEHRRKHDNRKFYCDVCPKVYTNRGNLFNHKRLHTGERPYACEFCDKTFSNGNSVKKHLLTHSGERAYVCDACGKGFTQKTHLKTHLRVHTGEKPYECDICHRMFSHKYVMVAHRRIHTGERPFQCDVCQRTFIEKSQLKKHKRAHHGE